MSLLPPSHSSKALSSNIPRTRVKSMISMPRKNSCPSIWNCSFMFPCGFVPGTALIWRKPRSALIGYLVKLGIQIIFINFIYGEGEDLFFVKSFHFFILAAFHEISHCGGKDFDIMPDIGHGIQRFFFSDR